MNGDQRRFMTPYALALITEVGAAGLTEYAGTFQFTHGNPP
jgi:hypothetical protein